MDSKLCYANADTPTPGHAWRRLSDVERLALVNSAVSAKSVSLNKIIVIAEAKLDGQVIVNLLEPVPANERGTLLLDLEAFLKESIDPGLVVWLEPLGDRSSLRNLRGIEVKA
ncbi:MAG: hypothetical protein ACYC2R_06485 [Burkholderiales bacterium]